MSPRLTIESGKKYDNHLHYTLTLYLITLEKEIYANDVNFCKYLSVCWVLINKKFQVIKAYHLNSCV
jgi:hypothetical protein